MLRSYGKSDACCFCYRIRDRDSRTARSNLVSPVEASQVARIASGRSSNRPSSSRLISRMKRLHLFWRLSLARKLMDSELEGAGNGKYRSPDYGIIEGVHRFAFQAVSYEKSPPSRRSCSDRGMRLQPCLLTAAFRSTRVRRSRLATSGAGDTCISLQ